MDENKRALLFIHYANETIPAKMEQEDGVDFTVAQAFTMAVAETLMEDIKFKLLVGETFYRNNEEEAYETLVEELFKLAEDSGLDEDVALKGIHSVFGVLEKILDFEE